MKKILVADKPNCWIKMTINEINMRKKNNPTIVNVKCLILILAIVLAVLPGCDKAGATKEEPVNITFVAVNDLHGHIFKTKSGKKGISNTAHLIDSMSQFYGDGDDTTSERDDIVLFANGDLFADDGICYDNFGEPVIMAMNEMGFDGMGIGNHEFDRMLDSVTVYFSDEELFDNNIGNESEIKANFPLVSTNVALKLSGEEVLIGDLNEEDNIVPYLMVEKMGVKIGLIAVIGPLEDHIKRKLDEYVLEDVGDYVRKAAIELKNQGAEIISVNMHYSKKEKATECKENLAIANVRDDDGNYLVDMIFDGHTHEKYAESITRDDGSVVPVLQGGSENKAVSYVKITYDKSLGKITSKEFDTVKVKEEEAYDEKIEKIVNDYYIEHEKSMGKVLCESPVTIVGSDKYSDLCNELMLKATGTDYAFTLSSVFSGAKSIYEGDAVTKEMLIEYYPFDDYVLIISLKKDDLSKIYSKWKYAGPFASGEGAEDIEELSGSDDIVTLAVIDYAWDKYYPKLKSIEPVNEETTNFMVRELLIEGFEKMN